MKSLAQAEAAEEGTHLKEYEAELKAMTEAMKIKYMAKKGEADGKTKPK